MIELKLFHDGKCWIACNQSLFAMGQNLKELDIELKHKLEKSDFLKSTNVKVKMSFDNSFFPSFIRQYSNHYFNRIVEFEVKK